MNELVNWLAPYLARFELPDENQAPTDLHLALNAAFGLDFTGSQLSQALGPAVLQHSRGLVSVLPAGPPTTGGQRQGAYLTLTGQRRVLISPGVPVTEWVD